MSTEFINNQWRLPNNENKDKISNYSWNYGTNSKFNISSPANAGITSSISFWFKRAVVTGVSQPYEIAGIYGMWMSNTTMYIRYGPSGYQTVDSATGLTQDGLDALTSTDWVHWVLIREATATSTQQNFKMYANTNEVFSSSSPSNFGSENTEVDMIWATAQSQSTSIDSFSIFNYALSPSQITTLYGSSSTGIGNPMSLSTKPVAFYNLGDQDAFNGSNYLVPNSSLKDYVFDFSSDSIEVSATPSELSLPSTTVSSGGFSISFWYYHNAIVNFDVVLQSTNANANNGFGVWQSTINNGLNFWVGHYLQGDLYTTNNFTSQKWYNITCTFESGSTHTSKIFIDGVLNNSVSYTTSRNIHSGENILIGGWPLYSRFFDGQMSNVQIFNTALPATGSNSVETLYNNGSPLTSMSGFTSLQGWWKLDASATYDGTNWTIPDDSTNSNTGTSSGMTQGNLVVSDLSFKTSISPFALDFDAASSNYISAPVSYLNSATVCTISFWGKKDASNKNISVGSSQSGQGIWIQWYSDGNIYFSPRGAGAGSFSVSYAQPYDNNWHHYLGVYNGSSAANCKLYLDGDLVATGSGTAPSYLPATTGDNFQIGALSTSFYTDGQMSNVSIWSTELNQTQVTEIYNEGVPSNLNNHSAYSNLVSWWQLGSNSSFNTNWTVIDEKGSNNGTSVNMTEDDIVDGVGSYANAVSLGLSYTYLAGDAPYSTANSLSVNMGADNRVTDTPS
tara:strand:- start:502 stop:2703 length:2202 start_codon:yes stop_codon:yes gene_type:complete